MCAKILPYMNYVGKYQKVYIGQKKESKKNPHLNPEEYFSENVLKRVKPLLFSHF